MERFNTVGSEKHDSDYHIHKEEELMKGEITPKDRLQNQIRLAYDLAQKLYPGLELDSIDDTEKTKEELREERNKIMGYWTKEDKSEIWETYSYSGLCRKFENEATFKENPRLQGDIFKITLDDIIYYKETGLVPEE